MGSILSKGKTSAEMTPLLTETNATVYNRLSCTDISSISETHADTTVDKSNLKYGFQHIITSDECKHTDYVNVVCYTGKYIISASDDTNILVWSINNNKIEFKHKLSNESENGHSNAVLCLFVLSETEILSDSKDGSIRQWNVETCQYIKVIDIEAGFECYALHFVNGLVVKGVRGEKWSEEEAIRIFRRDNDGQYKIIEGKRLPGHKDNVRCFASTYDNKYLFSGSFDKSIRRWELEDITKEASNSKIVPSKELLAHTDWVRCLCVTTDNLRLVSGSNDKTIRIWDVVSCQCMQVLTGHESSVRCVCISDDGSMIMSGSRDNTIRLWDLETGAPIRILRGHDNWVTSVCSIHDRSQFLSCSSDKTVRLWDVNSSPILRRLKHNDNLHKIVEVPVRALSGSRNLKCKISFCAWDQEQTLLHSIKVMDDVDQEYVCCAFYDRKENRLITPISSEGDKSSIIEWSVKGSEIIYIRHWNYLQGALGNIHCVEISESVLIIAVYEGKDILILKYSSDKNEFRRCYILQGHFYSVRYLAQTFDKKYLLSGSDDYTIKMWSIPEPFIVPEIDGKSVNRTPEHSFEGHTGSVTSISCIEDYMISGSEDNLIMVWCLRNKCRLRTLVGHDGAIRELCPTSINRLLSASSDGVVIEWDLSVGRNVPSDEELRELIRVRHKEYGFSPQVTEIFDLMTSEKKVTADNPSIYFLFDLIRNHGELSEGDKSKAQKELKRLLVLSSAGDTSTVVGLGGMMKTFELRIRVSDMTLESVAFTPENGPSHENLVLVPENPTSEFLKSNKLVSGEDFMIPLAHWMSHIPEYREYFFCDILPLYPEVMSSCTLQDKVSDRPHYDRGDLGSDPDLCYLQTLLSSVVQSSDPEFVDHNLKTLSLSVQKNAHQMMWHAQTVLSCCDRVKEHYNMEPVQNEKQITRRAHMEQYLNTNHPALLLDIENIALALDKFWCYEILMEGILSLQKAPHSMQNKVRKYNIKPDYWDSDAEEKMLVDGSNTLFSAKDVVSMKERSLSLREKCNCLLLKILQFFPSPMHQDLIQALYVPFPMRVCQQQKLRQHSSSYLLRVCAKRAYETDDTILFQSSVLTAILTFKLRMFGWNAFLIQCFLCFTLGVNVASYSITNIDYFQLPGDWSWLWSIILFVHFVLFAILEYLPVFLGSRYCLTSDETQVSGIKLMAFCSLIIAIVLGYISFTHAHHGSEKEMILSSLVYFWIFGCFFHHLMLLPSFIFIRMIIRVTYVMRNYIFILIIYAFGFALTFRKLMSEISRSYVEKRCDSNPSYSDALECQDMKETVGRFKSSMTTWVTMYMTLMGAMDWDSTAFDFITSNVLFYALIILLCGFIFMSNAILNITISLMNDIYGQVRNSGHAGCHLVQANYVLRIERLYLYFGIIKLEDKRYFPRWLLVLSPKSPKKKESTGNRSSVNSASNH